jgi:hypothetical protein
MHVYINGCSRLIFILTFLNVAFVKNVHYVIYERVRPLLLTGLASDIFDALIVTMSSLSTILVNRLVLNLRERAVVQLPTTIETVGRFQAALPVPRQPADNDSEFDIRSKFLLYPTKQIDNDSDSDSHT